VEELRGETANVTEIEAMEGKGGTDAPLDMILEEVIMGDIVMTIVMTIVKTIVEITTKMITTVGVDTDLLLPLLPLVEDMMTMAIVDTARVEVDQLMDPVKERVTAGAKLQTKVAMVALDTVKRLVGHPVEVIHHLRTLRRRTLRHRTLHRQQLMLQVQIKVLTDAEVTASNRLVGLVATVLTRQALDMLILPRLKMGERFKF